MVLNNKIHFRLLDEEYQTKKSIFNNQADMMKKAEVLEVGNKVEYVKKGDIIELYVATMFMTTQNEGFCSERDVVFTNKLPPPGKVHIKNPVKKPMDSLMNAEVVNSNVEDVQPGDQIFYRHGQSHILPDNSEILSETQIYHK